jgi:hypothetical protein
LFRDLLTVECERLRWSPKAIVLESPMPKTAPRWALPAGIAAAGVELFARKLRVPLYRQSLQETARRFGATHAPIGEILTALRKEVGWGRGFTDKEQRALAIGLAVSK